MWNHFDSQVKTNFEDICTRVQWSWLNIDLLFKTWFPSLRSLSLASNTIQNGSAGPDTQQAQRYDQKKQGNLEKNGENRHP